MSDLSTALRGARESYSIQSERPRQGFLKDCVLSCFFQHEVWVLHRLQQPTLEPHRKLTIFWSSLVTNCTWWLKYNMIMYNTSSTCWHFPSWWRHQYWDTLIIWPIACTHACYWPYYESVASFALIVQIEHLSCPGDAWISSLNFPPKCSAGVLFHLCVRSVNATRM